MSISELILYRDQLEKYVNNDTYEEELITDILSKLFLFPITVDYLKSTKIGLVLQTIKNKYVKEKAGQEAKRLLNKWRDECKKPSDDKNNTNNKAGMPPKSSSKSSLSNTSSSSSTTSSLSTSSSSLEQDLPNFEDGFIEENYSNKLKENRKKIYELFIDVLKLSVIEDFARVVASEIETALNLNYNADNEKQAYLAKAKSLIFNLKNNEALRLKLISNDLKPSEFVTLSARDLASDNLKETREESSNNAKLARRNDIYDLARSQIQKDIGLDQNGGEFVCRRCKGNKTTHYALQTRSSDEPMTVFVNCLTCGNRWRC